MLFNFGYLYLDLIKIFVFLINILTKTYCLPHFMDTFINNLSTFLRVNIYDIVKNWFWVSKYGLDTLYSRYVHLSIRQSFFISDLLHGYDC